MCQPPKPRTQFQRLLHREATRQLSSGLPGAGAASRAQASSVTLQGTSPCQSGHTPPVTSILQPPPPQHPLFSQVELIFAACICGWRKNCSLAHYFLRPAVCLSLRMEIFSNKTSGMDFFTVCFLSFLRNYIREQKPSLAGCRESGGGRVGRRQEVALALVERVKIIQEDK